MQSWRRVPMPAPPHRTPTTFYAGEAGMPPATGGRRTLHAGGTGDTYRYSSGVWTFCQMEGDVKLAYAYMRE